MLLSALLARNEADRDLAIVLQNASQWADQILLLDDNSTDGTAEMARAFGAEVVTREGKVAWGAESPARAQLWALASERVGDGWVVVQDADMVLVGDPRPLCATWQYNAWSWVLYDLWSETEYRADQFWRGHEFPRPWMFCPSRVPEGWKPQWGERGVHCGHFPPNFPIVSGVVGPDIAHWKHFAYCTQERREAKFRQYETVQAHLSEFEKAHARSILDPVGPARGPVRDGGAPSGTPKKPDPRSGQRKR